MPEIFKVLVRFTDDSGDIAMASAVEHAGHLWLVATWFVRLPTADEVPLQIVRRPGWLWQDAGPGALARFVLLDPIPRSVLDAGELSGFVVEVHPASTRIQMGGPIQ